MRVWNMGSNFLSQTRVKTAEAANGGDEDGGCLLSLRAPVRGHVSATSAADQCHRPPGRDSSSVVQEGGPPGTGASQERRSLPARGDFTRGHRVGGLLPVRLRPL